MGDGKGKKKTFIQNRQLIFKNILKYETDHLKTNPIIAIAQST